MRSLHDVTTPSESSKSSVESNMISGGSGGECLGVLQVTVLIEDENEVSRLNDDVMLHGDDDTLHGDAAMESWADTGVVLSSDSVEISMEYILSRDTSKKYARFGINVIKP